MAIHTVSASFPSGDIIIETGKLAKLADGAVTVRLGDTIMLVTAVSATKVKEGQDFFPLTVEYKEKAAAAGKFPGGYFKREGRPTEKEILTARMTDRPLRPLFPKGYYYDTQVIALLMSADGENDSDILAINGASAALCVSDIPFAGPIGAVRVARINGQFVVNPTHTQRAKSELDLVYVGNKTDVIMIEGAAHELPEDEFIEALAFAQEQVKVLVAAQEQLAAQAAKVKREVPLMLAKDELLEVAYEVAGSRIEDALYRPSKLERSKAVGALRDEVTVAIKAKFPEAGNFEISQAFDYLQQKAFRISILDKKQRCDGRGVSQIRPLTGEVGLLPRVHGSALFSRGETQAVALTTLAPLDEAQEMDNYAGGEDTKRFILHYNFPRNQEMRRDDRMAGLYEASGPKLGPAAGQGACPKGEHVANGHGCRSTADRGGSGCHRCQSRAPLAPLNRPAPLSVQDHAGEGPALPGGFAERTRPAQPARRMSNRGGRGSTSRRKSLGYQRNAGPEGG